MGGLHQRSRLLVSRPFAVLMGILGHRGGADPAEPLAQVQATMLPSLQVEFHSVEDGKPFCCYSSQDKMNVCGTCWPGAVAHDRCGESVFGCVQCGGHWCSNASSPGKAFIAAPSLLRTPALPSAARLPEPDPAAPGVQLRQPSVALPPTQPPVPVEPSVALPPTQPPVPVVVLPVSPPPAPELSCPANADLYACLEWCKVVAPGSSGVLGGKGCMELSDLQLAGGTLPECLCYGSAMQQVLKSCKSNCNAKQAVAEIEDRRQPSFIEVYYSPVCPSCRELVQTALVALVEAGLPGLLVNVSVLPILTYNPAARAQLCAMQWPLEQPVAVDAAPLKHALDFIACDLRSIDNRREGTRECAEKTGWNWQELESCAMGDKGQNLALTAASLARLVEGRLKAEGFARPPGIPWVFVGGKLLRCQGDACFHEVKPSGDVSLTKGSLAVGFVDYVCRQLSPRPLACNSRAVLRTTRIAQGEDYHVGPCENCFADLGHPIPLGGRGPAGLSLAGMAALLAAGTSVAALLLLAFRHQRRYRWRPNIARLAHAYAPLQSAPREAWSRPGLVWGGPGGSLEPAGEGSQETRA